MNHFSQVMQLLDSVLGLQGRSASFTPSTHLLGAVPELDSMAVVALISALESQFGLVIDDDDIDGTAFATAGSLADFVSNQMAA